SVDGTPSTIKVTINGTNDAATVSSATVAVDETDKAITTSGTLTSTDVDNPDNAFTPDSITGTHGDLTIDAHGHWVFTANSAFNQLNVGDKIEETFTVASVDGTQSTIKVTINGTNDAATVSSATVAVDETDSAITTSGILTSTDVDNPDNAFTPDSITGTHGDLTIDANGHWVFTANNAFNQLNVGDKIEETFTVASVDGTQSTIKLTINGTNDAATVSSATVAVDETDSAVRTSGILTSTDVDNPDNAFTPDSITGTHGDLTIDANGHWVFTANSAFNQLNVGDKIEETFTVASVDGTQSTIKVTINGTNDAATVSSATVAVDETDKAITTSGTLTSTDVDNPDNAFTPDSSTGTHGDLTIDAHGHWVFTANSAFNQLNLGDKVEETFTVTSVDGTPSTIKVTINGTNDAATVSSATVAVDETDKAITTSGTLTSTDVDNPDNAFTPDSITGTHGDLTIDAHGHWVFTANSAFNQLNVGDKVEETFTVASVDGTPSTIKVTINGTNDAAMVSSATVAVDETDTAITTSGTLTSTDVDNSDNAFTPDSITGTHGNLTIDAHGHWVFTANSAFNQLNVGDKVEETFTVTSVDGTPSTIKVTINGTNDTATVSSATVAVDETDKAVTTSGTLTSTDVDNPDNAFTPDSITGTHGDLTIDAHGHWVFTANSAFNQLNVGDKVEETFTVTSIDGTPSTIKVTINGTNDAATVSSATVAVDETDSAVTTSGTLTSTDVDNPDNAFTPDSITGTHGNLTIDANGHWVFTANSAFNQLNVADKVEETFTVTSVDGTPSTIKVTINGTNDAATVSSATVAVDETDSAVTTSGTLTSTDVDNPDNAFTPDSITGTHGNLTIDANGHWVFTANSTFNQLNVGDKVEETFTVTSVDGTPSTIKVTINGTNDKTVIGGVTTDSVKEDIDPGVNSYGNFGVSRFAGTQWHQLTVTDIDNNVDQVDIEFGGKTVTWQVGSPLDIQTNYGKFELTTYSHGPHKGELVWLYNGDNRNPSIQGLKEGESLHESITLVAPDGTRQSLSVEIKGTEDHVIIDTLNHLGDVIEDQNTGAQITGQLLAHDTDTHDSVSWTVTQTAGKYGEFSVDADGHWHYVVDEAKAGALGQGDEWNEHFTIEALSTDGSKVSKTVTVVVHGSNDAPTVTSGLVLTQGIEDKQVILTQQDLLAHASDSDRNDQGWLKATHLSADHGSISSNADGSFTFTPEKDYNGDVHFTYDVIDRHGGATHTDATINLVAVNDASVLANALSSNEVIEDHLSGSSSHTLTSYWKNLDITDTDGQADAQIVKIEVNGVEHSVPANFAMTLQGDHGSFVTTHGFDGHNKWLYIADNNHPEIQQLKDGQSLTDHMTLITADGTRIPITATIKGTEDSVIIDTPDSLTASIGTAIEDQKTTLSGTLQAHDVDKDDSVHFQTQNLTGNFGSFSVATDGTWHYQLDPAKAQHLTAGQYQTEGFDIVAISSDGSTATKHIQINVQGSNDSAIIAGVDTGSITEDRHVFPDSMHHIQVTGSLSISDPDAGEDHFRASGVFGHEKAISDPFQGEMHIDRHGNWDYVLANGNPAVQALKQGETKDVIYEVHSADGTSHRITITVTGTNDAPTVSSSVILATGKEDTTVTLQASDLLAHASDIDHNAQLSIHNLSADHGQIVDNHDGTFRFTPDKDYNGPVQFSYQVQDEHGASIPQTASMNLVAVNDVATISGDNSASVTEGGSQGAMPDLTVPQGAWLATISAGFDFPPVTKNDPNAGRWYSVGGDEGPAGGAAQGLDLQHGFWVMNMGDPNYGVNGYAMFTRGTNSATAHFNGVTDDAHGDLHITDPDATPDTFVNVQNQIGDHGYGTFTMKDGHWSFVAGDKATSLPDGAKAQETFTFRTHDGVTHQVTVNLTGTDTPSEFKGDFSGNLTEGNVGDVATVHGSISITDPDTNQTPTLPDMPATSGDNGYGSFTMVNGRWEYTLDQSKVQHVGAQENVQDKITVTASDGTKHDIVVTILGTNDAPVVNGQTFITPQNGNTPIALRDLLANVHDSDTYDNQHLSVSHLQADHGTITPDGHGGYLYHPENGYKGPVDISYQVTDPEGASVSVHASMGSAPTASSGIIQMHEDSPHTFTAAEFSADNFDQLTISSLPDVTHGTLTFNGQPVAAGQHIDTAHIDQLVFTPAQNYHGDASFGFTVSENGMQSAAASGHITVDSVTDAASISMHLSATEATMQSGQGNGLAVTRLDGSHLTHQTSPELTAEVVVKIPSGSHLNKESVLIQFGNAVAKGEQQGAAAVCKIYSDDSHTNTLNTFTVTNPQNLTIWLPGHKPIQTGIDITQNHDPHRLTFSVNTASHSATVYQDGQPVFHTNSAQIWHDSDLGMNSYNTAGDDAQIFGNPTFWFNHQGRGGDHIPIFIAKAVGHTGVNLGDGLHPLMNENGQVMYSDGQMKAPASDLSVQAVFTSAVIMQGEVTAQQVASGPLSESTPGIGSGRVLLELGIQGGQLVDHTGHQSNALEHHSLNSPLIGGDPLHHELNLDVQATDPDDHVTSVKLSGLPDGTMLDDGHGHTATVHNGKAVEVQDWYRSSIGVVLPNTAPTGDVRLHVEVTTTGPDGSTATSTADNTSMHVSDVMTDTAPDIIQSIMLGDEDQTYHFSVQDFGYSDKDGDPLDHITITQLPEPAHGQLLINGHAVTAGQEIPVYDIGKLLFQPAKDFNGDVDFQYSVSDGLKDSAPSQGTLTIAPVVDVTIKLSPASDLGSSNTDNLTNDATPTITGHTDIPYSQVTIYDGSKPVGHAVSDASGQYSIVVNSLTDGNHNLSAKALTPSSGISATSSFLSVHIDTQVHVGIQMDPITADSVINAQESNSSINITGAVSGDFSIGDIVTLDVNGAQHTGTVDAKGHYSIAVPGSELIADADQQIEASIMVTDSAGNSVHAVTNGAYQVDTQVNLPTITFENPGPDGLYSKAEIAHGHPNTVTATITPPGDAKVGEHLVVNGQDHVLDTHTLQHGLRIEVSPDSQVQVTMTDEHGNTAGSQGVAASAIPEPIVVKPPSGSHQVSGTLGVPPLVPSQTPVPSAQNGWRIHLPNGQYVTSHHGQYGTLTIDPQTGHLHYQEQAQVHTGPHGSASGIGQHEDKFEIALQGTNQDEVVAHVNVQILSHGPGHSGKLTVGTEVVDMTITPVTHSSHPAPPPPPPEPHDIPGVDSQASFTVTQSDDSYQDLTQHVHQESEQKTSHHGAAAYLDALGIKPDVTSPVDHDQPADIDIVLAQVDQQHAVDYDQAHLDMSDALEHHDTTIDHNQDDEHHHHNDVDGLPDIDPNN
uniref:VCBS domain-containing protein n=1 Tax=Vibrio sp. WZ-1 TaxID=3454501 RepID=UPI003F8711A6